MDTLSMATAAPPGTSSSLDLGAELADKKGIFEIKKGLSVEIIEKRGFKKHRHFKGSLPESRGIEKGFDSGPVYAIYSEEGHVDVSAGLTLVDNRAVRQTAVVRKLIDNYETPSNADIALAPAIDPSQIILPLSSQRIGNYCRWWLDSIAKLFICSHSTLLRSQLRGGNLNVVLGELPEKFQRETIDLLKWQTPIQTHSRDRLLRGRSINSSGVTFGGGQRIGAIIKELPYFLDVVFPDAPRSSGNSTGPLLYISRNEASMRRLMNEDEIIPGLKDMGFHVMRPGTVSLANQIAAFRDAKVIVAVHGAGLTNIIFCRPGTTLVEIFPEGGVRGSAFLRISSRLGFNYYFVVGKKVANVQGRKNPNNSNLTVDKQAFLGFIRQVLADARL
jgi:Glycosyltransferase 61